MIPNFMKNKVVTSIIFSVLSIFNAHTIAAEKPSSESLQTIVIFGDSLSAAYGMDIEKGWASLLAKTLKGKQKVINASISGETSTGGLARMPITLSELEPDLLILQLGANDGLQGLSIKRMRSNLEKIIQLNIAAGVRVALIGISLPPSYGPRYIDEFRSTFSELASQYQLPFIDFYREDFVAQEGNIQADGLHPTEKTQTTILAWVLEFLTQNELLN